MLHDLDLVSVQEVRSKVDKTYQAGQDCKRFSRERAGSVVAAGVPPGSVIRDTVAGVAGSLHLEKRAPVNPEAVAPVTPPAPAAGFVCGNDVLASVARDGKIFIGPWSIVASGASDHAARRDVLVQR